MSDPVQAGMKQNILDLVAANDLDAVPDDLPNPTRFFATAVRAAAEPSRLPALTLFIYSDNARLDAGTTASRVVHLADGCDDIAARIVFSGRDVNNGWALPLPAALGAAFDHISNMGFGGRPAVVWDGPKRKATFYANGIDDDTMISVSVPISTSSLTQDEVCAVLNELYNEGMKTPSAHTVKVWVGGKVQQNLEDEIERFLKAVMTTHFSARSRSIKVFAQTTMGAGRSDLVFLQRTATNSGLAVAGLIELKVLRGTGNADIAVEGLQQGHEYKADLQAPFATLALYDVGSNKTPDTQVLLSGIDATLTNSVRVRRFPLYKTPQEWRQAGGYVAC